MAVTTVVEVGATTDSATESLTGSAPFALTASGVDSSTATTVANGVTGLSNRTESGRDVYTLSETGTAAGGAFSQGVVGTDNYTGTDASNSAAQTDVGTTTGGGTWTRTSSGPGSTLASGSGTNAYVLSTAGNAIAGVFGQSETGTDRYRLVQKFDDASNATSGQTPGNVTFHSHGLAFRDPGPIIYKDKSTNKWVLTPEGVDGPLMEFPSEKALRNFVNGLEGDSPYDNDLRKALTQPIPELERGTAPGIRPVIKQAESGTDPSAAAMAQGIDELNQLYKSDALKAKGVQIFLLGLIDPTPTSGLITAAELNQQGQPELAAVVAGVSVVPVFGSKLAKAFGMLGKGLRAEGRVAAKAATVEGLITKMGPAGSGSKTLDGLLENFAKAGSKAEAATLEKAIAKNANTISSELSASAAKFGNELNKIEADLISQLAKGGSKGEHETRELLAKVSAIKRELAVINPSCFVAGTPLLTPEGSKAIEQFRAGDRILSRPEGDAYGPTEVRIVEEVFTRTCPTLRVTVSGRVIETTHEHPIFVVGKGWRCARELRRGDCLSSHNAVIGVVEEILDTEEVKTVYNLRVADWHTYFVGCAEWGFSVWAHNAEYVVQLHEGKLTLFEKVEGAGLKPVEWHPASGKTGPRTFVNQTEADIALNNLAGGGKGSMPKSFYDNTYRKVGRDDLVKGPDYVGTDGKLLEAHPNKHKMPKDTQVGILNDWEKMWTGLSENGRPVDVYYKNGQVVVTHQGDKAQVITAYGRGYGDAVDPSRWLKENWKPEEVYSAFDRSPKR